MGNRKYPSIFELALKAGKWSVIAGSSAAIIGATGCLEQEGGVETDQGGADVLQCDGCDEDVPDIWMGVVDVYPDIVQPDVVVVPDYGYPELAGVAPYDSGYDSDGIVPDDVTDPDVVESDPGLLGDWAGDVYPPTDVIQATDVEPVDVVETDYILNGGAPMEDI